MDSISAIGGQYAPRPFSSNENSFVGNCRAGAPAGWPRAAANVIPDVSLMLPEYCAAESTTRSCCAVFAGALTALSGALMTLALATASDAAWVEANRTSGRLMAPSASPVGRPVEIANASHGLRGAQTWSSLTGTSDRDAFSGSRSRLKNEPVVPTLPRHL